MSDIEACAKLYLELANLLPSTVKSSREIHLEQRLRLFASDVKRMRAAQKQYFKTRGQTELQHSKFLENDLDAHADGILDEFGG